ncbi:MAG: hypothetical protein ABW123_00265, partial [Cystobacter sp.]
MKPAIQSEAKPPGAENSWLTPGGHVVNRLDFFLNESLRRRSPDDLARYRIIILIALVMMVLNGLSLLALPMSPKPWMQAPLGLGSILVGALALVRLRGRGDPEQAAILVCLPLTVGLLVTCFNWDLPYSASHATTMLLPALSVYLLGARRGLFFTLPVCLAVGVIHPVRYTLVGEVPGRLLGSLWISDVAAALCMLCIWAVSWLHSSSRLQAQQARE